MLISKALNHIHFDPSSLPLNVVLEGTRPQKVPVEGVPAIPNADTILVIKAYVKWDAGVVGLDDWVEIDLSVTDPFQLAQCRAQLNHLINRTVAKYEREKRIADGAAVILPLVGHQPHRRNRHKSTHHE